MEFVKITVNGEIYSVKNETTLIEVVRDRGFDEKRIAVEINGEIVPKASYSETLLKEGDSLEVVRFVGGG